MMAFAKLNVQGVCWKSLLPMGPLDSIAGEGRMEGRLRPVEIGPRGGEVTKYAQFDADGVRSWGGRASHSLDFLIN